MDSDWLLCDFHIHTDMSDANMPLTKIVDLYGKNDFDIICITDHVTDKRTLDNRRKNNENLYTIEKNQFSKYLHTLWKESERAWQEYNMLLIPGMEITNNHDMFHLLAIDVKEYIDPDQSVEAIIEQIHEQNAIAIACHPHHKDSEGEMPFIHLWENQDRYVKLFDAWEVANRDDLFNVIGLKKFNYIAGSDFHEERHVYSWKTLIKCEKNTEAVKEAIRRNRDIAIYLFRKQTPKK